MADRTNGRPLPKYRSKSPERSFDEVKYLVKKYDRKTFAWVDPTWNLDPRWCDRFSDLVLRSGLKIQFTAWMRADGIVRDEKLGILEKEVAAGLVQAMMGVERIQPKDLEALNKHNNSQEITAEAFRILRSKYPSVYTIGTMIYGLWDDTRPSLDELLNFGHKSGMDYGFFIPLTPNPGTEIWRRANENGMLATRDFSAYNFHTPVMRTRTLSRRSLENFYLRILLKCSLARFKRMLHFIFFQTNRRKKEVHAALVRHGLYVVLRCLYNRLVHPFSDKLSLGCRRPRWYNS
jgi:anaerobic magnesium-protoporphyrin IX monomethyl ester cyclase